MQEGRCIRFAEGGHFGVSMEVVGALLANRHQPGLKSSRGSLNENTRTRARTNTASPAARDTSSFSEQQFNMTLRGVVRILFTRLPRLPAMTAPPPTTGNANGETDTLKPFSPSAAASRAVWSMLAPYSRKATLPCGFKAVEKLQGSCVPADDYNFFSAIKDVVLLTWSMVQLHRLRIMFSICHTRLNTGTREPVLHAQSTTRVFPTTKCCVKNCRNYKMYTTHPRRRCFFSALPSSTIMFQDTMYLA